MTSSVTFKALLDFPLVNEGDDLAHLIKQSLDNNQISLQNGDALVIAQKIVSKAEGRLVFLNDVVVSERAKEFAAVTGKDPRLTELILGEAKSVIRARPGIMIVEHKNGYVMANAGIDKSNILLDESNQSVLLLPEDANKSAELLREKLVKSCGVSLAIIINDSIGRAWRNGTVGLALGTCGFQPLWDQVGEKDMFGNVLEATLPAIADELAAGASFVMGQSNQGQPVIHITGCNLTESDSDGTSLLRPETEDLFR